MFANFDVWTIIGIVLVILGTFFAGWTLIRTRLSKVLQEFGQLAETLGTALQDNKITDDEKKALKAEYAETKEAVKELIDSFKKKEKKE